MSKLTIADCKKIKYTKDDPETISVTVTNLEKGKTERLSDLILYNYFKIDSTAYKAELIQSDQVILLKVVKPPQTTEIDLLDKNNKSILRVTFSKTGESSKSFFHWSVVRFEQLLDSNLSGLAEITFHENFDSHYRPDDDIYAKKPKRMSWEIFGNSIIDKDHVESLTKSPRPQIVNRTLISREFQLYDLGTLIGNDE